MITICQLLLEELIYYKRKEVEQLKEDITILKQKIKTLKQL